MSCAGRSAPTMSPCRRFPVPTDTAQRSTQAVKFALRGVAWSLGFFGLLRLTWTETHVLLPLTRAQAAVAVGVFGAPALPVEVTLACSGADALALCLGAILAYPVPWRRRVTGAAVGAALILRLEYVPDRHAGTSGCVAGVVRRASCLHLARRCSRSRPPDMCLRGCASPIAGRHRLQQRARPASFPPTSRRRHRPWHGWDQNRRADSPPSPRFSSLCFWPPPRSISRARPS